MFIRQECGINIKFAEFDHHTVIIKEYPCSRKYADVFRIKEYEIYNLFSKVSGKKIWRMINVTKWMNMGECKKTLYYPCNFPLILKLFQNKIVLNP